MTTAASTAAPDPADVASVVTEVWASFAGDGAPLAAGRTGSAADRTWCGVVSVAGGWRGTVVVEIDDASARAVAAAMLGVADDADDADEADITDDDVTDAVGELANMVGGNVKGLMPGPSTLSLPSVAAGPVAVPSGARVVARVDLPRAEAPLRVSVHCPHEPRGAR